MKKILLIIFLAGVLMSCGSSSEGSGSTESSDTSVNSISPPPNADTTGVIAPMMGDTSKPIVDSLKR